MRRRTYLQTLVTSGVVAGVVGIDALGTSVVHPAQAQTNSEWSQQAKLVPDDGDEGDRFAADVAVSGDGATAVIGAQFDEDPNGAGSAYVFSRDSTAWNQQAKLFADDGNNDSARFGEYVGMSSDGTTAVIGAPSDHEPNGSNAGSAYVFTAGDGDDGPPPLPGQENPPQDLDGDGLYEDVNGDGEFTIADVQVFFQNRDSNVVQDNPEFFNFAGDEPADVSIGDVQALFQLFQEHG